MRRSFTSALIGATLLVLFAATGTARADEENPRTVADRFYEAGNWKRAAEAYTELTLEVRHDGELWFRLGRSLHNLGEHERAVEAYGWALDNGYDDSLTMFETARALAASGDAAGAIDWLGRLADSGSTARLQVANAPELKAIADEPGFERVLDELSPCRTPEYRQFDFWLGTWSVASMGPDGKQRRSSNRISSVQGGCVVLEEYEAPTGYAGTSLSYYDASSGKWNQTWIDNQGQPLVLSGGLVDGKMVLSDRFPGEGPVNRITWTPSRDGRVRQEWETSPDGGRTWSRAFYGVYTPAGEAEEEND